MEHGLSIPDFSFEDKEGFTSKSDFFNQKRHCYEFIILTHTHNISVMLFYSLLFSLLNFLQADIKNACPESWSRHRSELFVTIRFNIGVAAAAI